jgi:hypothetical protein
MADNKNEMNIPNVNITRAERLINHALISKKPIFIWGTMGVGKSDLVRQISKKRKYTKVVDIRCATMPPDEWKIPFVDLEKQLVKYLVNQMLPTDPNAKELIYLDEVNASAPMIQGMLYQFVLDRQIAEYKLPKNCDIILSGNRASDKGVVNSMPSPLRNRMLHINLVPEFKAWKDFMIENKGHGDVIAFNEWQKGKYLHTFDGKDQGQIAFASPRSWVMVSDILKSNPPSDLIFDLVCSTVGRALAVEFEGYRTTANKMPKFEDIIERPTTTEVPDDPCCLYALCSSLSRRATENNWSSILTYVKRMGKEMQTLTILDALKVNKDISNALQRNSDYIDMAVDIQDLRRIVKDA